MVSVILDTNSVIAYINGDVEAAKKIELGHAASTGQPTRRWLSRNLFVYPVLLMADVRLTA